MLTGLHQLTPLQHPAQELQSWPAAGRVQGQGPPPQGYPLADVEKDQPDTALGLLRDQRAPQRYHWFRSRGLFAGSGAAESGCKAVVQRPKLSGMR